MHQTKEQPMAALTRAELWEQRHQHGYLPGQPGYISTLSANEMFPPSSRPKKSKSSFTLDPFIIATIVGIAIAAISLTIYLLKHYGIF